ncbi:MAG: carboxypeptidase-like regulatory domain-containing protein [Bacteroidia bacterium]
MKKLLASLLFISTLFILIYSCSKDEMSGHGGGNPNTIRTTISGMVLDENNAAINNVTITAYSQTTTTNQYGVFVLKDVNINKDRCIIHFTKAGYFNRTHAFISSANTVNYVRVVLISNAQTHTLQATLGGTVTLPDNSSIQFAPNSFVTAAGTAYTGIVNLTVKHLSPDAANFGFMIPGGDLAGQNLNGDDVALVTYGMMGIELKGSSGETLQLASGTTATLTLSIAASQVATAPATIPLWYFDETTSLWKEEGTATKVGNNYVGTVQHFSWWNCDYPCGMAYINGKVVDCEGSPLANIFVTIIASNGYSTFVVTNQNGVYTILIAAGFSSTVQVITTNNPWLTQNSQLENIPALTAGQTYNVPDLGIPCPTRVIGTIKTCAGENTLGIVFIFNGNGFSNYYATETGLFNIPVIENAQLELLAFNNLISNQQIITSLVAPNTLDVGNLLLCDSTIFMGNNFVLNGGSFSNQSFNISATSATAQFYGAAQPIVIQIHGTALPDYQIDYSLLLNDTLPGVYTLPGVGTIFFNIYSNTNIFSVYSTGGQLSLIQVDPVGGRVKGNYLGLGMCSDSLAASTFSVSISGNFDVLRTQ